MRRPLRRPSPTSFAGEVETIRAASGTVQPVKARMFINASFMVSTLPAMAPLPSLGIPRLGSGAIAGSVLTMKEAFINILAFTGCTVPEAARMVSTSPAKLVGEGRRKGRLVRGYDADVTVLRPDLSVETVWRGGKLAYSWEGG